MSGMTFPLDSGHRCFLCGRTIDVGETHLKVQKQITTIQGGLKTDVDVDTYGTQVYVCLCLICSGERLYDLVKGGDDARCAL